MENINWSDGKCRPKVSIIIPVYNVQNYLEECLYSVANQTLHNIEIICVNDGSTDHSLEILHNFEKNDTRFVVISQKNAGAGAARNKGLSLATGEYIGFVDSDDYVYPTMYEEMYNKAVQENADLVIMGEIETTEGENICFPEKTSQISSEQLQFGSFTAIEYPEVLKNVFLWNRIYSTDFWKRNKFLIPEKRRFAEDLLICTQTIVMAERIAYVGKPLYKYRNSRQGSLSFTLAKSSKKYDYIVAMKETKEFLKDTGKYKFYGPDFLLFSVHLYILLLPTILNMGDFKRFFSGICEILDKEDINYLKKTWLYNEYRGVINAIEQGKWKSQYCKNFLNSIFRK